MDPSAVVENLIDAITDGFMDALARDAVEDAVNEILMGRMEDTCETVFITVFII